MGDATTVQLPDGRLLAYTVRGDSSRPNAIVWLHGIVSSRFECSGTGLDVLAEQDAYIIGFDRPGYGLSSPHRGRTYRSFVQVGHSEGCTARLHQSQGLTEPAVQRCRTSSLPSASSGCAPASWWACLGEVPTPWPLLPSSRTLCEGCC